MPFRFLAGGINHMFGARCHSLVPGAAGEGIIKLIRNYPSMYVGRIIGITAVLRFLSASSKSMVIEASHKGIDS